jgi:Na+/H+ antiporter NhaD/arsenite permease-like protein
VHFAVLCLVHRRSLSLPFAPPTSLRTPGPVPSAPRTLHAGGTPMPPSSGDWGPVPSTPRPGSATTTPLPGSVRAASLPPTPLPPSSRFAGPRSIPGRRRRERRALVYKRWVYKGSIVAVIVIAAFVAGVPPALAALAGAAAILLTRAVNPERVYKRIDFGLMALFVGLFVIVAGVERVGLGERLLGALSFLSLESTSGLTVTTAIVSNVVSNVPAVMVLKTVVSHLPRQETSWLVLAMSSTLAGNLTLAGSLASLIVAERAKRRCKITFWDFAKVGAPGAILSLTLGALWLHHLAR